MGFVCLQALGPVLNEVLGPVLLNEAGSVGIFQQPAGQNHHKAN